MLQPYHFHFTCGHNQISKPDRIPVDGIENHKRRCIQCEPNTLSARVLERGLKFVIKWVAGVMVKVKLSSEDEGANEGDEDETETEREEKKQYEELGRAMGRLGISNQACVRDA
ncbi:hypothetical protein OEA41_009843 [Lepraria neglecta]|uniref:Uncharacterized protein n=1 Tax=Lepraria neglecta TaxID=209136 RepID=A0AAD9YZP6_9LECA|nr:hypothetical protein OEA41_009843 [Lepraria neglecta]